MPAADTAQGMIPHAGDTTVSWSVLVQARLREAVGARQVARRLAATSAEYPHLGPAPAVTTVDGAELAELRESFATRPYVRGDPLVRVALTPERSTMVLAAHHSAVDGLGLLALLGSAIGHPVSSSASGIGPRLPRRSFGAAALRRISGAFRHPPARTVPTGCDRPGDLLVTLRARVMKLSTADLVVAAGRAVARHAARRAGHDRIVAAVGVSRSGGDRPEPRDESAYFLLPIASTTDSSTVTSTLTAHGPEPAPPAGTALTGRVVRWLRGALADRVGATYLVSNLGAVDAGGTVSELAFFPIAGGRSGVAFGAATVGDTTTVTIRARHRHLGEDTARDILSELFRQLPVQPHG
ncbi:hypothetical protein H0B56_21280 [Haloechinothrix sp. YIM 98757]|uniref:Condensation domain-containing protein n=1 Tax=Haloechinothrix aidingensis TaxID=2752311 RepID=A0A838AFH6_9PSEU|nr:hypothetical protein [Haloechinothrix aidingensis]MBA0128086.1 hypothetical protein [Haloechinothrix aidingensis]